MNFQRWFRWHSVHRCLFDDLFPPSTTLELFSRAMDMAKGAKISLEFHGFHPKAVGFQWKLKHPRNGNAIINNLSFMANCSLHMPSHPTTAPRLPLWRCTGSCQLNALLVTPQTTTQFTGLLVSPVVCCIPSLGWYSLISSPTNGPKKITKTWPVTY